MGVTLLVVVRKRGHATHATHHTVYTLGIVLAPQHVSVCPGMCESQRYPFRVGDQWRRQIIGGKYAEVVKKAKVTVIFEIKLNSKTLETPVFSVWDYDEGLPDQPP